MSQCKCKFLIFLTWAKGGGGETLLEQTKYMSPVTFDRFN